MVKKHSYKRADFITKAGLKGKHQSTDNLYLRWILTDINKVPS